MQVRVLPGAPFPGVRMNPENSRQLESSFPFCVDHKGLILLTRASLPYLRSGVSSAVMAGWT